MSKSNRRHECKKKKNIEQFIQMIENVETFEHFEKNFNNLPIQFSKC